MRDLIGSWVFHACSLHTSAFAAAAMVVTSTPNATYVYPSSYQEKNSATQATVLSLNRYLVLGLAGLILLAFFTVLVGLGTKRPTWWYATLTRWFNITDHDTTSNLLVISGQNNGRSHRPQQTSSNPLTMRLDAWRTFQEEKHVPPPHIDELRHLHYLPPPVTETLDHHTMNAAAANKSTTATSIV
ncbi:hypothetical protein B5M09_008698 [Aphanomyces astaci]|uniref:Uncharacterized protein n=2 Tax=Aphanomyces astaci TaxID=112090 RepID=A0A425DIQ3_APHAT|nr:hypothetical protein B5M09_008698 [Aphanomyces astaci]